LSKGDGLKVGHFGPETASFDRLRMLVGKTRRKLAPQTETHPTQGAKLRNPDLYGRVEVSHPLY
jgi:hypothetical protein